MSKKSFDPASWSEYFDVRDDIHLNSGTFRIYRKGFNGVLLFCLHGGGFSGLSWALLSKLVTEEVNCQMIAVDMRGHGDTICEDEKDFRMETLTNDIREVIFTLFPTEAPPLILVGHSMGGAIAINLAASRKILSLAGLIVIDVVEGTAMEALRSMKTFLSSRPSTFKSLSAGIQWSYQSHQISNLTSAKISFPGHLKRIQTNETATSEIDRGLAVIDLIAPAVPQSVLSTCVEETEEANNKDSEADNSKSLPPLDIGNRLLPSGSALASGEHQYTWRIDLNLTAPYWTEWFQGMSLKFLSIQEPKLLIVAGVDRLDTALTVAQMQGKFQFHVMPKSGHAVHEDQPEKVAALFSQFLTRYRFATAKSKCEKTMPRC